jgi:LysR family transcriptional regulator, carnitine catabolism transcriptional activator
MSFNITVKHLRAFTGVARLGSFTRAAEELALSQPALTVAIRQLEDSIGTSLFDRTTRRVTPTPEGSDFLPIAERLLVEFDGALQEIRGTAQKRRGRVGIASVHSVATQILSAVLRAFTEANADTSLQLHEGNSTDVRRRVRDNEVDIGIGGADGDSAGLDCTPLFRDQMGLLARADHVLFRTTRPLTWQDLAKHDFLGLTGDQGTRPILFKVPNLPPSVLSPRFEVSNNSILKAMLEAGLGVTAVAALTGMAHKSDPLQFRPISGPVTWRTVHLITRRGRTLPRAVETIAALIGDHVRRVSAPNGLIEFFERSSGRTPQAKSARRAPPRTTVAKSSVNSTD